MKKRIICLILGIVLTGASAVSVSADRKADLKEQKQEAQQELDDTYGKLDTLQAEQEKIQEELNQKIYEASSGGGMVTAKVTGACALTELTIKPECVDPQDVEMLQDMIISAVNEAVKQAKAAEEAQVSQLTGGLNIPGLKF